MWGGEGRRGGNERGEGGGAIELCVLCVGYAAAVEDVGTVLVMTNLSLAHLIDLNPQCDAYCAITGYAKYYVVARLPGFLLLFL